jgi:hypothetical protein
VLNHPRALEYELSERHDFTGEAFVRRACVEVIEPRLAEFGGREVMTTLWALQRLGHRPTAAVLEVRAHSKPFNVCDAERRRSGGLQRTRLSSTHMGPAQSK